MEKRFKPNGLRKIGQFSKDIYTGLVLMIVLNYQVAMEITLYHLMDWQFYQEESTKILTSKNGGILNIEKETVLLGDFRQTRLLSFLVNHHLR